MKYRYRLSAETNGIVTVYGIEYQEEGWEAWYDLLEDPSKELCEKFVQFLNENQLPPRD